MALPRPRQPHQCGMHWHCQDSQGLPPTALYRHFLKESLKPLQRVPRLNK